MKIKPIGNRLLIEPDLEKTASGLLYIPETVKTRSSNRQLRGKIVGVPTKLKREYTEGTTVLFDDFGERVEYEGKTYTFLDPEYVIGEII